MSELVTASRPCSRITSAWLTFFWVLLSSSLGYSFLASSFLRLKDSRGFAAVPESLPMIRLMPPPTVSVMDCSVDFQPFFYSRFYSGFIVLRWSKVSGTDSTMLWLKEPPSPEKERLRKSVLNPELPETETRRDRVVADYCSHQLASNFSRSLTTESLRISEARIRLAFDSRRSEITNLLILIILLMNQPPDPLLQALTDPSTYPAAQARMASLTPAQVQGLATPLHSILVQKQAPYYQSFGALRLLKDGVDSGRQGWLKLAGSLLPLLSDIAMHNASSAHPFRGRTYFDPEARLAPDVGASVVRLAT